MSALYVCDACHSQSPGFRPDWFEIALRSPSTPGAIAHACSLDCFVTVLEKICESTRQVKDKADAAAKDEGTH